MGGRRPARRPFKTFVMGFVVLVVAALGGGAALLYEELTTSLPSVEKLLDYKPPAVTRVLANDGSLIGEFFIEKRYPVPIHRIPRVVQLAFVAAEDASFYEHPGIDAVSIARAALSNYRAGETRQGGSTITQQIVKSLLLTPERSYERKVKEVLLALRIERELTKDEILALYLNQIYLGNGAYGVQAAAREYFAKNVSDLSLAQAALLAGLPQAPSRDSPMRSLERAKRRQRYVLLQMVKAGFVTAEMAEHALLEPLGLAEREGPEGPAPYFVEHVRRFLVRRYGTAAAYQLGLDVYTTLDLRAQAEGERALREGVAALDERQGFRGPRRRLAESQWRALANPGPAPAAPLPEPGATLEVVVVPGPSGRIRSADGSLSVRWAGGLAQVTTDLGWATGRRYTPQAGDLLEARIVERAGRRSLALAHSNGTEGSLLAVAPRTGDVVAMVGGLDWSSSKFNRATQAHRQPGSSFKPLIFAAALDRGFTPSSVINDAPVSYPVGDGKLWSPRNFSNDFRGPTTLREALVHSRNVVTVKLVHAMGMRNLIDYLPRFGFQRPFPKNLSIALGSAEVTLLEQVQAYGVFANLGMRVEPRFITHITDRSGRLIEEFPVRTERVMSAETAYLVSSMMQDAVARGTGKRAQLDRPVAGKTGTTNDMRDAWFIGFTPELIAGVWVGYDQDRTLGKGEVGGRAAAPIWRQFMAGTLASQPIKDFELPSEIVLVSVDRSGARVAPGASSASLEAYRRGTEPAYLSPESPPAAPAPGASSHGSPSDLRGAPPPLYRSGYSVPSDVRDSARWEQPSRTTRDLREPTRSHQRSPSSLPSDLREPAPIYRSQRVAPGSLREPTRRYQSRSSLPSDLREAAPVYRSQRAAERPTSVSQAGRL